MIVQYGTYRHADNECKIRISREAQYNEVGLKEAIVETWDITGYKQDDTQALLTADLIAMENAYRIDNQNLYLTSGGAKSAHWINANLAQYVRAFPVSYPIDDPGEYTTYRQFAIRVEARFIVGGQDGPGSASDLISYEETIDISGTGGPIIELARVIAGPWIPIITSANSPVVIVQSGSAVGGSGYPTINPPIDPGAILNPISDFKQRQGTPKTIYSGYAGNQVMRGFPSTWSYTMTYPTPQPPPAPNLPS